MRSLVQFLGFVLVVQGASGAYSILADKPQFGFALNAVNRHILPQLTFLKGYEMVVDVLLVLAGVVVILAAERTKKRNAA